MKTKLLKLVRPDGCLCGDAVTDHQSNVLSVRTCPICSKVILDIIRGGCYATAIVKCGDTVKRVLLKQKEFFSLEPILAPDASGGRDYYGGAPSG